MTTDHLLASLRAQLDAELAKPATWMRDVKIHALLGRINGIETYKIKNHD